MKTKAHKLLLFSFVVGTLLGMTESLNADGPVTLWNFLGIPQGFQKIRDVTVNRRGNRPGLERKDPLKRIADPANLESENPAIKAAAKIKKEEDLAKQKIKAIKYLAKVGCGCYPDVAESLLAALDDCTEDVRKEAAIAFCEASGNVCDTCEGGCCNAEVMQKLHEMAHAQDEKGCYVEASAEVREAARNALNACRRKHTPGEVPAETPPPEKKEVPKEVPIEATEPDDLEIPDPPPVEPTSPEPMPTEPTTPEPMPTGPMSDEPTLPDVEPAEPMVPDEQPAEKPAEEPAQPDPFKPEEPETSKTPGPDSPRPVAAFLTDTSSAQDISEPGRIRLIIPAARNYPAPDNLHRSVGWPVRRGTPLEIDSIPEPRKLRTTHRSMDVPVLRVLVNPVNLASFNDDPSQGKASASD